MLTACIFTPMKLIAKTIGIPAPSADRNSWEENRPGRRCTEDSIGSGYATDSSNNNRICWLGNGNTPAKFNPTLKFEAGQFVNLNVEFSNSYFPSTDNFKIREFLCAANSREWCVMSRSFNQIDGANTLKGNTTSTLHSLSPNFGGNNKSFTVGQAFSICLAFIDEKGIAWRTTDPITCSDAKLMPDYPSMCRINNGQALDVDLGIMEYEKIKTSSISNDNYKIKKSITFSCTSNATISVITHFEYQPSLITTGGKLIKTSNENIGVSIFYNNQEVGPNDQIPESYAQGSSSLNFEFQPTKISDSVPIKGSITGELSASLIMVMSVQ